MLWMLINGLPLVGRTQEVQHLLQALLQPRPSHQPLLEMLPGLQKKQRPAETNLTHNVGGAGDTAGIMVSPESTSTVIPEIMKQ